ncbi:hypothetical protein [Argonema antarcticum]|nr:hypothetical protein [Argonema antarcticum]
MIAPTSPPALSSQKERSHSHPHQHSHPKSTIALSSPPTLTS